MAERFECKECGKVREIEPGGEPAPECCGRPMEKAPPLPFCTTSETAEHSRMDHLDEPCDDGRSGNLS